MEGSQGRDTYSETDQRLAGGVVDVDAADAALAAGVGVVEPDGVVVRDRDGEGGDRGAVARVAEAGVEAVDGLVDVVRGDAGGGEHRLDRGVVSQRDCTSVDLAMCSQCSYNAEEKCGTRHGRFGMPHGAYEPLP